LKSLLWTLFLGDSIAYRIAVGLSLAVNKMQSSREKAR
jgi:hypothetical protein